MIVCHRRLTVFTKPPPSHRLRCIRRRLPPKDDETAGQLASDKMPLNWLLLAVCDVAESSPNRSASIV